MPEGWPCECGEKMRHVGAGEYECPRCDHPRKVTPKRKTETYARSTDGAER